MLNWLFRRRIEANSDSGSTKPAINALPKRPRGTLIWVHHDGGVTVTQKQACAQIQDELRENEGIEVGFLLSSAVTDPKVASETAPDVFHAACPNPSEDGFRQFCDQWRPDMVVFLSPITETIAHVPTQFGIETLHVHTLAAQSNASAVASELMLRTNDPHALSPVPAPPKCNDAEAESLAAVLHGRPTWLAAAPANAELKQVLETHLQACRIAHRLLLFLVVPQEMLSRAQSLCAWMEMVAATRDEDGEPSEDASVFLISGQDEMGIWYRLAPVTFVGGSFSNTVQVDPNHPASMGSAVMIGPNSSGFQDEADMLVAEGAARLVPDFTAFPKSLVDLLSPDIAANIASNAWSLTSRGADVQNVLIEKILLINDAVEARPT